MTMDRRDFLRGAGALAGAATVEPVMGHVFPPERLQQPLYLPVLESAGYVALSNAPYGIRQGWAKAKKYYRSRVQLPDGTADDVELAALLSNAPGTVVVSEGNAAHTAEVAVPGGRVLRGQGRERTIFTLTAAATTVSAFKLTSANSVILENFSVKRAGATVPKSFIYIWKSNRAWLRNLHLEGSGASPSFNVLIEGVDGVEGSYNCTLEQIYCEAGARSLCIRSVDANGAEVTLAGYKCGRHGIYESVFTAAATAGIRLSGTRQIEFYGVDNEFSAGNGIELLEIDGFQWVGGWNGGHSTAGVSVGANVSYPYVMTAAGNFQHSALLGGLVGAVVLVGVNQKIMGQALRGSGASTGTGAQQTIAHGLPYTPTQQQIALFQGSATANPYHSAAPDGTNFYVTAVNLQAWYWSVVG